MKLFYKFTAGLLSLAFCAAPISANPVQTVTVSAVAETPDPALLKEYTDIIVSQVNDARAANHLSELSILPVLNGYTQIRAGELPVLFSHNRPDGRACFTVIKDDGFFYNVAAENIAAGNATPLRTFEQWMNSEMHRANILRADFTHIGIGYVYDPDSTYKYHWAMFLIGVYDTNSTPLVYEGQYIPERETGDADGSHEINAADASAILMYAASHSAGLSYDITDSFRKAADVNADGQVNAIDASILLAYSAAVGANGSAVLEDFVW